MNITEFTIDSLDEEVTCWLVSPILPRRARTPPSS